MATPPDRGAKNGDDSLEPVRNAASRAVASVLALPERERLAEAQWPLLAFFIAKERPKLHKSSQAIYDVAWAMRLAMIDKQGQVCGFSFAAGTPARTIATMLRSAADRIDQVCDCVERGVPVPDLVPVPTAEPEAKPAANEGEPVPPSTST